MDKFTANNLDMIIGVVLVAVLFSRNLVAPAYDPEEMPPEEIARKEKRRRLVVFCSTILLVVGAGDLVTAGLNTHDGPWTWHSGSGFEVTFPYSTGEETGLPHTPFGNVQGRRAYCNDPSMDAKYECNCVNVGMDAGFTQQRFISSLTRGFGPAISQRPIAVDGWGGIELVFATPEKYHMTFRCVVGHERSVWLTEIVPDSAWSATRKSDFLDSLHFDNPPPSRR